MEELQDAIEDAQYVNAIATQEEGPRPVLSWDIPTEEQLVEWEQRVRAKSRHHSRTGGSSSNSKAASLPDSNSNSIHNHSHSHKQPEPFSCDWYLTSAISLYLFSAYLKEECNDYLRINFIEEVLRWRKLRGKHRVERAKKIVQVYLKELPVDDVTGTQVLPEKTQIDEYDLSRSDPIKLEPAELQRLEDLSWDPNKTTNCLGLKGVVVEELLSTIRTVEKAMPSGRRSHPTVKTDQAAMTSASASVSASVTGAEEQPPKEQSSSNPAAAEEAAATAASITVANRASDLTTKSAPVNANVSVTSAEDAASVASGSSAPPLSQQDLALRKQMEKYSSLRELTQSYRAKSDAFLPNSVFDKIDALVIESLRKEYWAGFTQSEQFKKLRNFLWFQDRRVVPDDFFTMRVLGRGGFGSVIGK